MAELENEAVEDTVEESEVTTVEEPDFLNMSDEELAEFDLDSLDQVDAPVEEPVEAEDKVEADEDEATVEETEEPTEDKESEEGDPEELDDNEDESDEDKDKEEEEVIDYKSIVEELYKPFKANGKEMKVDNVEDVRTLMKMGANYNKKMVGLKPHLKLVKMLENNGLLDESKLSFLIDIDKKNPDAINRLIKESGIDPLEIDVEKNEYKPVSYTVDDSEVELEQVLNDIRDTKTYHDTINVVSNKWDDSSKQAIVRDPKIIEILNTQMENGIYAQVSKVVESERMLGRLGGMSDLEAYRHVGDSLYESKKMVGFEDNTPKPNPIEKAVKSVSETNNDTVRKDRKRAAAVTKTAPVAKAKPDDFNPLSLSDDEFSKMSDKFL